MKLFTAFLFLLLPLGAFAQPVDTSVINITMHTLDYVLVHKDTVKLNKMLHPYLTYGHSNGWVQTKKDVMADLYNGKLSYKKIEMDGWPQIIFDGVVATVRSKVKVSALMNGKDVDLDLQVLQVWLWRGKAGWVLLSRQSVKI